MIIIKNEEDEKQCTSPYGNHYFELSMDEIVALLQGKTLGDPSFSEYGTFISMEVERND